MSDDSFEWAEMPKTQDLTTNEQEKPDQTSEDNGSGSMSTEQASDESHETQTDMLQPETAPSPASSTATLLPLHTQNVTATKEQVGPAAQINATMPKLIKFSTIQAVKTIDTNPFRSQSSRTSSRSSYSSDSDQLIRYVQTELEIS
jgi:hypothetical protein